MSRKFQSNLNVWCKTHTSVCRWHLPVEITPSLFPLMETVSHVTAANLSIWCLDLGIMPLSSQLVLCLMKYKPYYHPPASLARLFPRCTVHQTCVISSQRRTGFSGCWFFFFFLFVLHSFFVLAINLCFSSLFSICTASFAIFHLFHYKSIFRGEEFAGFPPTFLAQSSTSYRDAFKKIHQISRSLDNEITF